MRINLSLLVILLTSLSTSGIADDLSSVLAPNAKLQLVTGDCRFTEGPASDAAGNVYFTDQPNDRIVRVGIDGTVADFMKPAGRSNGMFFLPDGKLLACADEQNQMWEIDVKDGTHKMLFDKFETMRLNGPNDVWIHPSGVMPVTCI